MNPSRPKVSVLMLTYNHEKFVGQALESVLAQKTNFPSEVVVADDCSTDETQFVLRRYVEQRPDVIRPVLREVNVGVKQNFRDALEQCRGDYVALLDGDDYWIDEYKLQKQVDFLEANPDYVLVGGNAITQGEGESEVPRAVVKSFESRDVSTADLIDRTHFATLTMLFRNRMVEEFPIERFKSSLGGDRIIQLVLSLHGKCRYMHQVFGVYRVHNGGITDLYRKGLQGMIRRQQDMFFFANEVDELLNGQYKQETSILRSKHATEVFGLCLRGGYFLTALRYAQYLNPDGFRTSYGRLIAQTARWLSRTLKLRVDINERFLLKR